MDTIGGNYIFILYSLASYLRGPLLSLRRDKASVVVLLASGVFLFICSLEGVGYGFNLMFSEWAHVILSMIESGVAPFTGLAIGVLATTLLESSSAVVATTMMSLASIVASGLPLGSAIRFGVPMILGANVGTTVGNTITLLAIRKATTRDEFNATIPGVLVDDIFKFLTVGLFFVLEVTTGFLSAIVTTLGAFIYDTFKLEGLLVAFEKTVIDVVITDPIITPLGSVFVTWFGPQLSGILFFILWFALVVVAIDLLITKGLNKLLQTGWETRVSSAFQGPVRAFATGFSLTWLVGSSSIGTSLVIPMIATKIVSVDRAYPYICGCSLATTMNLAQLYGYVAGGLVSVMLGLTHILLNLFGLVLWLISPLRVLPLRIAKRLGQIMTSYHNSAIPLIGYAICVFIVLPLMVILLC